MSNLVIDNGKKHLRNTLMAVASGAVEQTDNIEVVSVTLAACIGALTQQLRTNANLADELLQVINGEEGSEWATALVKEIEEFVTREFSRKNEGGEGNATH